MYCAIKVDTMRINSQEWGQEDPITSSFNEPFETSTISVGLPRYGSEHLYLHNKTSCGWFEVEFSMEGCMDKMAWCKAKCPKWPVARKCCFCVPIRKGVTIFGYVNLVLALLSFPLLVFLLVEHLTTEQKQDEEHILLDPHVHLPLTIMFVVIDVIMTVVLLIGAHRKKELLLKIYFYFGVVFQLFSFCVDLAYLDYREYLENAIYLLFLCLNIYLLFLVYNTVHVIEESSEVQYVVYRDSKH